MRGDMPEFSDETLLGYLLDGLSEAENAQIEAWLLVSEPLRVRLADLRGLLEPGAAMEESFEPRSDLVADTMAWIADEAASGVVETALSDTRPVEWSEAPVATRLAWLDSLVALAAGIIFLSFLLPSVWRWRESARQVNCAENLRNVGAALTTFLHLSGSRQIPVIDTAGPLTFAGVYALRLQDHQLLDSASWLQCPSNRVVPYPTRIPTSEQFLAASPEQQRLWRYLAGGNYAYHLGNRIAWDYETPSIDAPIRFAVLGDMWPTNFGAVHDASEPVRLHGDRAANILFNDGSIHLIRIPEGTETMILDNPFLNREGRQGVGIGLEDACLGPSFWLPAIDLQPVDLHPVAE